MRVDVNLSSAERGVRLRSAVLALATALGLLVVFAEAGAPAPWWATVVLPLFVASLQIVQAYTGVCIYHARRGTRVTVGGEVEPILDAHARAEVRARARAVVATAAGIALGSTALAVGVALLR